MAPRRGRRRRQDRRRRRHPRPDPAELLQAPRRAHRPRGAARPAGGRHGVPAAHRLRRAGDVPLHRRIGDPALRLRDLRLAPGARRRLGDRREGQRHPARDRADHDRQHQGGGGRPVRAGPVHHPAAHREGGDRGADQGLLHLLAVVPVGHLQGHVPGRAAHRLLSRPARRPVRVELRDLSPALFDQHLPDLAPGPAVPGARPQRRDQHPARQRQLDEVPRGAAQPPDVRRAYRGHQAGDPVGQLRFGRARRGVRAAGAYGPHPAGGQDADDPGQLDLPPGHPQGTLRPVRVRQRGDGAVGRAGGDLRLRRPLGDRGHGPQRPAPAALHHDDRRPADRRLRDRHDPSRRFRGRGEGPGRPRPDDRRRPARGPALPRPRDQGPARHAPRLRRMDQAPDLARFADRGAQAGQVRLRPRVAAPSPDQRRLEHGRARADPPPHGRRGQGGDRLDGRRHAARRAVGQVSRPAPLLPAEFQPGHQPADRQPARTPGDVAQDPARQPRQHPRRGAGAVRPAAARIAGPAQRRVRSAARLCRQVRRRDRLHLRPGHRRHGAARRAPSHLPGGRGRDPRRPRSMSSCPTSRSAPTGRRSR